MSAKETAVEAMLSAIDELITERLDAFRSDLGMLPRGAAGSEVLSASRLAAANKRIAELEEIVKESTARKPVWDKLDAMAEKLVSIGEHPNASPEPAATDSPCAKCHGSGKVPAGCPASAAYQEFCTTKHEAPCPKCSHRNRVPDDDNDDAIRAAATEGDWDGMALLWLRDAPLKAAALAAEFRRIASEAERRGQVKGLRWAVEEGKRHAPGWVSPRMWDELQRLEQLEHEGKGAK